MGMKRLLACLVLAAMLPVAAKAETLEYTHIEVVNGTAYYIYVDTWEHHGLLRHHGLVAPNAAIDLQMKMPDMRFFTDVHVYVKKVRHTDPDQTICHVMKRFGNTTGKPMIVVHVHYNGTTCSIDDV